jgi:hypothetical protein|tara:strand:- start:3749 stop:3928 length:180 start_codon:yes stop_codon:yes gene_type:complete
MKKTNAYIEGKNWHSLTQLRDWLESNTKQKTKYFDGMVLRSDKYSYTLDAGKVQWTNSK